MKPYKEYRGWYEVRSGQTWTFGPDITLTCGSALRHTMFPAAQLVFTDPPWTQGNMTAFYNKAQAALDINFMQLIDGLAVRTDARHIFIEMGNQQAPNVTTIFESHGYRLCAAYPATYYNSRPCQVLHFAPELPQTSIEAPGIMDDSIWPAWAIKRYTAPSDLVIDPCCGRGLIPLTAVKMGRRFWGNELNPIRLCITLEKLTDLLGFAPTPNDSETSK